MNGFVLRTGLRRGKGVTTTFTCPENLLSHTDEVVNKLAERANGYKLNRSRLIQALLEIMLEAEAELDPNAVMNHDTLCLAVKVAIRKPRHKHY